MLSRQIRPLLSYVISMEVIKSSRKVIKLLLRVIFMRGRRAI